MLHVNGVAASVVEKTKRAGLLKKGPRLHGNNTYGGIRKHNVALACVRLTQRNPFYVVSHDDHIRRG